jgi:hypothetical protein
MFIKNSSRNINILLLVFCILWNGLILKAKSNVFGFVSSKGLKIKIIKDTTIPFIHAEVLIFYRDKSDRPAISYLVKENMFSKDLNRSNPNLLSVLRRLGNDYQIEHRPDYLKIGVNFLLTRFSVFTQFLKELYSYKAFGLKKYNDSIFNFKKYFFKNRDAGKKVAQLLAYNRLFSAHLLGNTIIDVDTILKINLAQIRSFYRKTYKPENSFLFIKGNVNPHITFGLVEKALKSFKKQKNLVFYSEKLNINRVKKIYILDVKNTDAPTVYWFHVIPPLRDDNHLPSVILNNILFGYPIGNLFKNAGYYGIRNIKKMESEVIHHAETSVICNTVKLNYNNIEKFILLYEQESRKLRLKKINRNEYLNTLNYFLGKAKVDSGHFGNDIYFEINKSVYSVDRDSFEVSPKIFQKVTLSRLNQFLARTDLFKFQRNRKTAEIIVIVGNPRLILKYFRVLKPEIIRYMN